ncbi:MAG: very short patch repair endonuclease [Candidatus Thermoplasmatota archaeon]
MDHVDALGRSRIMASVRSKNNGTTERKLRAALAGRGLRGWRTCARDLPGSPDFVFPRERVAVFVDGCFWHGCTDKRLPKTRREFWRAKIARNEERDTHVTAALEAEGWRVLRIWEHELKPAPAPVVERIVEILLAAKTRSHAPLSTNLSPRVA